jgi:hypothetical protein
MNNDHLMYKDDSGKWVTYDQRWKANDETINKTWKAKPQMLK